jgi:hypothetical protein
MLADALTYLYASSRRARRLYALLLLFAVIIPVASLLWLAASTATDAYSALQERRYYLGNLLLVSEAARGLDAEAAPDTGTQATFLKGKNREVIGAELQNWLNAATQGAGAELQSIEGNSASDDKQAYIGLSANVYGAWKSIQNVIFRVETARPVLFVRELEIHSGASGNQDAEPLVSMRIAFRGTPQISERAGR